MATYLELVKELASESGSMDARAITSVTVEGGRPAKMANWVRKAYTNLQNSRRDWGWLVSDFTGSLVPGTSGYMAASFSLPRFSNWMADREWFMPLKVYDPDKGVSDQHSIGMVSFEEFDRKWRTGTMNNNRPTEWTISPRNELLFGPTPDKAYVVSGMYQKGPQVLTNNEDVPEMPVRFHDIIVWEAQRLMLLSDGALNEAQYPTMELVALRHQLEMDQLPEVKVP